MDIAEVFEIDDTNRFALYYDYYTDNPLEDWDNWDGLGSIVYREPYLAHYVRDPYTNDIGANELIQHWIDQGVDDIVIVARLNRHGYIARTVSLYGSSQNDWLDVIAYTKPSENMTEPNDLKKWLEPVQQFWQGDVYIVSREQLVVYTNAESGNTIERWEPIDSVGGCYLEYGVTVEELAQYV